MVGFFMNELMEIKVFLLNKRTFIGCLLTIPAFAGSVGSVCEVSDVTTSCLQDSWGIEAHALLLNANTDAIDIPLQIYSSQGQAEYGTNPTWQWGFQVGGTYIWNTGNDFVWSWSNYRNDSINKTLAHPVELGTIVQQNISSMIPDRVIQDAILETASFNTTYEWDQINFEFGQPMDFPVRVKIRPHAGLQISRVANYLNTRFGTSDSQENSLFTTRTSSMFNGLGPRSGLELRWESDWGLSVYGRGNLGLMYGPAKNNEYVVDILANATTIYNASLTRIVSTLDSQLGAECQFDLAQGIVSLDMGWQWNTYQGALKDTSFSIQGLFFGLKWLGTLA